MILQKNQPIFSMKKINSTALILLTSTILLLQSCHSSQSKEENNKINTEKIPVKMLTIASEEITHVVQASGVFTTNDETILSFKTGGIIEKVLVKEGDALRKNQLLATLNLTEIDAQVAQARLAYEKSIRDQQRVKNLYRDSVATLEQFQNINTAVEVAARQYEAAKFNRSHSEIRALEDGFVLRKMASEGQVVGPGTPVLQTNGAVNNNWKLRTAVSDREWAFISIGDKATITTDALPGQILHAHVSQKSEGSEIMGGSFTIELTLDDKGISLASGLYGKAIIETTKKQTAWRIPYEALLDGNAQTGYVFTITESNLAKKISVSILRIERDHILINRGLENIDQIIISGSAYLKDGSVVEIRK
jgi:RND family efflux transporter MFP subunit